MGQPVLRRIKLEYVSKVIYKHTQFNEQSERSFRARIRPNACLHAKINELLIAKMIIEPFFRDNAFLS